MRSIVAKRRKVSNLLALMVLATLTERPMHPYEMGQVWRARGKEASWDVKWGSLYTVVNNLEKHGFIEATGTVREGRRPERTVYAITPEGIDEMQDWLEELVSVPEPEFPRLASALSVLGVVAPADAIDFLERRLVRLRMDTTGRRAALGELADEIPRLFLVEEEYTLALADAEVEWIRGLLEELKDGTFPGMKEWRYFHETGEVHPSFAQGGSDSEP